MSGWLDQSWWPDGLYTAPTDEALMFDLQAVKDVGYNVVRLHQKVNSQRWYYHADRLGILILQDMIQKFGQPQDQSVPLFIDGITKMIKGRGNHPSIVQWTVFNEGDCVGMFNNQAIIDLVNHVKALDPSRLVDTNSGGPANALSVGDVNDIHDYPNPQHPMPSESQYAMIGEYGGLGYFVSGHQWYEGHCWTYQQEPSVQSFVDEYIAMTDSLHGNKDDISVAIFTQITDVELECDGYYNYDRTLKLTASQLQAVYTANQYLIYG